MYHGKPLGVSNTNKKRGCLEYGVEGNERNILEARSHGSNGRKDEKIG